MVQWQQKMKNWAWSKMDLPLDVTSDLPKITTIGNLQIHIENHKGLQTLNDKEIRLFLKQGQLQIIGNSFIIKSMSPEEILLEGKIEQIIFIE